MTTQYSVRITRAQGESFLHTLVEPETRIGSDPSSDITLPDEPKLLPQHILLAPRADQCWVSTASGAPLWDENANAITATFVAWGSRLSLGGCRFELLGPEQQVKSSSSKKKGKGKKSDSKEEEAGVSKIILLAVPVLLFALFSMGTEQSAASASSVPPPDLFEGLEMPTSCSSSNHQHRAEMAETEAIARDERSVFDRQDGIVAVQLLAEAEACYRAAGSKADGDRVKASGAELSAALREEFQLRHMQLTRALEDNDSLAALAQIRILMALVRHQADGDWALSLRRIELRLSKELLDRA